MRKTGYTRYSKGKFPALELLLVGFMLLLNCQELYGQQRLKSELIELPIYADGSTELFEVALNQIGILPRAQLKHKEITAFAKLFDSVVDQTYNGGIIVIQRTYAQSRESLAKLAQQIRNDNKDVLQAGLVLYPKGSNVPLVISDELVVLFSPGTTKDQIRHLADKENMLPIMQAPLVENLWLFRLKQNSSLDIVDTVKSVASSDRVEFTHPNIFAVKSNRQAASIHQWHHVNTGQGGPPIEEAGTPDADIDSDLAWNITRGRSDISIAVIDESFDLSHPDLANHTNGYNFVGCTDMPGPTCGSTVITEQSEYWAGDNNHGTAVAGLAVGAKTGPNNFSGTCPDCTLIPIQQGMGAYADSLAILYAGSVGARVVTNSWGYEVEINPPGAVTVAIETTAQTGAVMFWAMNNIKQDDCLVTTNSSGVEIRDISTDPHVISISAISNQARKVNESAYGDCMSLLSPSHRDRGPKPNTTGVGGVAFSGSLNIATTDRDGPGDFDNSKNAGYNNEVSPNEKWDYDPNYCPEETTDLNYTLCFGGTSAATPIAAGIGGLVLSVSGSLTSEQVKRLLQDTADKVQDSIAKYSKLTGKSEPGINASGETISDEMSTHGFGRVNAYEAVHVVAPVTNGNVTGLGGTDIFIRDNRLDWGNTRQMEASFGTGWSGSNVNMEPEREFIAHYQSVDIKVDAPDLMGNYRSSPTPLNFDSFTHENPVSGAVNKVFVRVHNRGPEPAENVQVKLHWTMAGTALPALPGDFWNVWPADSSDQATWHSLGSREISMVGYSGASVAGTSNDGSEIVSFDFTGPPLDPSLPAFRHHCLFAVIDSPDDPVRETRLIPDRVTPTNNNVTHRNLAVQDAATGNSSFGLMVRNPFSKAITTRLKLIKPKHWKVFLSRHGDGHPFEIGAGKEIPVMVEIVPDETGAYGEVEIRQEVMFNKEFQPFGGFVYRFRDK